MVAHVFTSPQLHRNRAYAVRMTLGVAGGLALLLFAIPAPHHLNAQGVVWLPDQAHIRAGTSGFVTRVAVRSEEHTSEIQSLMRISYAVFGLKKKNKTMNPTSNNHYITTKPNLTTNLD